MDLQVTTGQLISKIVEYGVSLLEKGGIIYLLIGNSPLI